MNWKPSLFKPKWQNKNAEIRLDSVSNDQHPDLISSLLEIAANDSDKRVRAAAIRRLHQLGNILKLHATESDPDVLKLLEERIRQLASSSNESRPPLELRMQVLELTSNRDLIEHLASHAPEATLRRAALAKVVRQGVLGDCAINDSDAEIRKFAASRVSQHTTLKRVIDKLRKLDKSLHSQLQERLHRELLEQADAEAVQLEALRICTALEHLALSIDTLDEEESGKLHDDWQRIAAHASEAMKQRYQRVCERFAAPSELNPNLPPEVLAETPIEAEIPTEKIPVPEEPSSGKVNESLVRSFTDIRLYAIENAEHPRKASVSKLKHHLEKSWKRSRPVNTEDEICYNFACALLEDLNATLEKQQEQFAADLANATELVLQLETELEKGELHKALEIRAALQALVKGRGKNREWQALNGKMYAMQTRLRELRDWQHWSNNKIRKRLIAEMEVLPSADLHPDALLDRIKSLQQEWKQLEQSEQIPGDKKFSAAPWMWRKFSAAGHTAFDTAKPFLDKRSEIQSRHAQSLATFCAELQQLTLADPVNWVALGKGITRGRKKLRDLNEVPANQRQKLARKLKAALDKANAAMQVHYRDVELEKMKLIRSASQLIHMPERSEAISQAKALQSSWKAAGSLWRSKEQELWNQFRAHLDPLFAELKNEQATIRAADSNRLAAQTALCNELREILKSEEDLPSLHGKIQGLHDAWKDIEHPERRLQLKFQDMVAEYDKRVKQSELKQVKTNRERWWLKSSLLHELAVSGRTTKGALSKKSEARVTKAWPEDSSDDEFELQMDETCKKLLAGDPPEFSAEDLESKLEQTRALCIMLEFLAGLPSPDEDREQRMKYQVDRLAQSMSGESSRQPAAEEALEAEKTWLGLYMLPEKDFAAFSKRVKPALSAILETV